MPTLPIFSIFRELGTQTIYFSATITSLSLPLQVVQATLGHGDEACLHVTDKLVDFFQRQFAIRDDMGSLDVKHVSD